MGMRIPSSGMAATNMSSVGGAAKWQQQRQNMSQLSESLQAGDLAGAQKVFSTISANSSKATDPNSPLGKIGQALQTGDLQGAQQAFTAMRSGGHHHHTNAMSAPQTPDAASYAPSNQTLDQKLANLLSSLNGSTTTNQSASNATPEQTLSNIINSLKSGIGGSYSQAGVSSADLAGSLINLTA